MQRPSFWTPERVFLLVLLVTAAIYLRDLSYDFVLDDFVLTVMNPIISSWHNLGLVFRTDIFHAFHGVRPGTVHYRPIYISWLLVNNQLFGPILPWWHLTSLLLHLGVTAAVFYLALQLLNDKWMALFAAALFALHPIHVEAVAYVTASTDVLATLFTIIAFLFYLRFRRDGGHIPDLIISLLSAAAAVLSKESGGMFPWLLVAYELLMPLPDAEVPRWKRLGWTVPFFGVGAAYVVVRTLLFGFNDGPGPGGSRLAVLVDVPLDALVYLKNLLLPTRFSFMYPAEWSSDWTMAKAIAVVLVGGALVWIWRSHRDRPTVRMLLAWTAVLFAPAVVALTAFSRDEWVHDRHMYLASVPVCLLCAVLLAEAIRQRRAFALLSAAILALLAIESWRQVPRFQNELTVYKTALQVAPNNASAHRYYGFALSKFGRYEQSFVEFRKVIELRPESPAPYFDYANVLMQTGHDRDARIAYEQALAHGGPQWKERSYSLYQLAVLETRASDLNSAAAHLHEAIGLEPEALNYHAELSEVLKAEGHPAAAEEELRLETINRKQFLENKRQSQTSAN